MSLSISNSAKKPSVPRAFFVSAAQAILGRRYELSVAFVSKREMRRFNRAYRGTDRPTDVLAFPLDAASGELIFCQTEAGRRAARFGRTPSNYLRFLVIHGLLHLKGLAHGATMEKQEIKFRKKFGI